MTINCKLKQKIRYENHKKCSRNSELSIIQKIIVQFFFWAHGTIFSHINFFGFAKHGSSFIRCMDEIHWSFNKLSYLENKNKNIEVF